MDQIVKPRGLSWKVIQYGMARKQLRFDRSSVFSMPMLSNTGMVNASLAAHLLPQTTLGNRGYGKVAELWSKRADVGPVALCMVRVSNALFSTVADAAMTSPYPHLQHYSRGPSGPGQ